MATRQRMCAHCGGQFEYEIRRGADRIHCSPECKQGSGRAKAQANPPTMTCSIEGCGSRVRSWRATLCDAHYCRLRRTGSLDPRPRKGFTSHSGGYVVAHVQGHPLSTPGNVGKVYEHRRVYHEEHGEGPFSCHHCGVTVGWGDMHVDHLNDVPDDNDPSNLVASCAACNQGRGRYKMVAAQRAQGRQLTAFGRTQCLNVWADETGIPRTTLTRRLNEGWQAERALGTPSGPTGRKR